jgi:hypothetical protein
MTFRGKDPTYDKGEDIICKPKKPYTNWLKPDLDVKLSELKNPVTCDVYNEDYEDCINSEEFKNYKRRVNIAEEYQFEYKNHYYGYLKVSDFDDFKKEIENADIESISKNSSLIFGRNYNLHTWHRQVSRYASYPEFRNWATLKSIMKDFENNEPIAMPIIIECSGGDRRVMSGNTRSGIAASCGIDPKVIVIKSDDC